MIETPSPVVVVGASGHARSVVAVLIASGQRPIGCYDPWAEIDEILGVPVLPEEAPVDSTVLVAIGDNDRRAEVAARYSRFTTAVHPSAIVSADVKLGSGTVIMAGAIVNSGTSIGSNCIINTGAVVEHECTVDDFVSVGPGATLGGRVRVGRAAAIFIGADVVHARQIGPGAVVGAGAVVIRDIPASTVAYGVPARPIRSVAPGERFL